MSKERRGGGRPADGRDGGLSPVVAPGKVSLVDQLGVANPVTSAVPGRSARTDRLPLPRKRVPRGRGDVPADASPAPSDRDDTSED